MMYQRVRHNRLVATDAHAGDRREFLRRHEAEARDASSSPGAERDRFLGSLWSRVTDTRVLMLAAAHVMTSGGLAAGVDGISPADLDQADVVALVRDLRSHLLKSTYRPAPERRKEIPKGPGRGTRTLSLSVVADRILQRAILLVVQPFVDPQLSPTTFGGRPGYSTADALIAAEQVAVTTGAWVWVTADVKKAFDEIPHSRLIACLRRWFGDTPTTDLIVKVLTTGRTVGIPQGGALSTLGLNLYLHDFLDCPFAQPHPDLTIIRWVDDILIACKTQKEAADVITDVTTLLNHAGLKLKDSTTVTDLVTVTTMEWLGLRIGAYEGNMTADIRSASWTDLLQKLRLAHREDRPTEYARNTIQGWLAAIAMVPPNPNDVDKLNDLLAVVELNDVGSSKEIETWWQARHDRYILRKTKKNERREKDVTKADEPAAPPADILAFTVPNSGADLEHSSTLVEFDPKVSVEDDDNGFASIIQLSGSADGDAVVAGVGKQPIRVTVRLRPHRAGEFALIPDHRSRLRARLLMSDRANRPRAWRSCRGPPADARPPPEAPDRESLTVCRCAVWCRPSCLDRFDGPTSACAVCCG